MVHRSKLRHLVGCAPKSRDEVERKYVSQDDGRQTFIIEADGDPIGYIQAWSDEPPDDALVFVALADEPSLLEGFDRVVIGAQGIDNNAPPSRNTKMACEPPRGLDPEASASYFGHEHEIDAATSPM